VAYSGQAWLEEEGAPVGGMEPEERKALWFKPIQQKLFGKPTLFAPEHFFTIFPKSKWNKALRFIDL
jgi:hypothetical protein